MSFYLLGTEIGDKDRKESKVYTVSVLGKLSV